MGCVNTSSSEFKALAAKHNLSSTNLELIVHKYWKESGNETLFPTDVYIQQQLGNGMYQEKSANVRKLWNLKYKFPKRFSSLEAMQQAYSKAKGFFPQSALTYYKNADGTYTLRVKKPVTSVSHNKQKFFKDYDSMKSAANGSIFAKEGKLFSMGTIEEVYNKLNSDRTSKDLASKVFALAKSLGINASFSDADMNGNTLPSSVKGIYLSQRGITYNKTFFESSASNADKANVILHEVIHAVSMYALSDQIPAEQLTKPLQKFRKEANALFNALKDSPSLKGQRGTANVREFIAELGNPAFRERIQEIDKSVKDKRKKTLWQKVVDLFKHLFNLHVTDNYYQRSMNAIDKALSAFDIDTYMKYTGIKNTVRKNAEKNIREVTQLNRSLSVIDSAVGSGNWTAEALTTVNNLVNDIENGKVYYQRFPQGTARAWHQGGRANEVASLLLRAGEGSGGEHPLSFSERYERDKRQQPIQEQIVEAWAKAAGVWHDNLDSVKGKALLAQGGEAKVFYNSGDSFVTKIISTSYFITPQLASDRITLHNALFPVAPLKVIGFGRNSQGEFQFLVEQPFVQGSPASQREIDSFIEKSGFAKSSKDGGHTFTSDSFYVSDLHDENVIKTPQGILVVIDADLRLNTPELGMSGKYHVDNSVTPADVPAKVAGSLKPVAYAAPLKSQYRGKLIYAQSGTGKSTIADNISVFDSDYILGNVLGVSPETAGFFFKSLSAQQKKAFGAQYREAVKDKVAQGFTVLTANDSLLPDADVIVYNSTPEQTDERVNRADRAVNNRYHAISYHEDTLSKIKDLKNNDKNKEYIELDKEHYLADYLLSSVGTVSNISNDKKQNESLLRTRGGGHRADDLDRNQLISDFLNEFGISIHILDSYDGEIPLFDALNRVINAKDVSDITDGVGYAIAFMMQGDPEMQRLIVSSHLRLKGDLNRKIRIPFKGKRSLKNIHLTEWSPVAKEVVAEVGRQIASELRNNFDTPIEKVKSDNKVWNIIKNFFKKIGMSVAALGKRGSVKKQEKLFVRDIIEALGREDFSRIKGPLIKQDTLEKAQRVDIGKALREHPFEDNIIRVLGNHGIALAGSASIALEGSLFRPAENPLHDIDFNAGDNSSKKSLDRLLPTLFQKDTIAFASQIVHKKLLKKLLRKSDSDCITYVTLSVPFETRNRSKNGWVAEYYSKDGRYLGRKDGSELYLENGVQGKLLDFFVGPTQESNYGFHKQSINGHTYLISNSNAAMAAKILWARPKDMWDYKHFKRDSFSEVSQSFINSLSEKQLDGELALMRQEEADYDIVNGIEQQPKQTERTGPQSFTFDDGTTIMAPFKPNEQQVAALNAIDNFIKSKNEPVMTLSGYAGTGKTSIMEMIADKASREGKDILFCATTNKATSVLGSKVSKQGFNTMTMDSAFGIRVKVNDNQKSYNMRDMVNYTGDSKVHYGQIVIIDEASMLSKDKYDIVKNVAKQKDLKIIFLGDEAQLPPVNEKEISKVFRSNNGKVVRLTQVERTGDNAILKEATDIRNGSTFSGVSSFNSEGKGVAYMSPRNQQEVDRVIQHFSPMLKSDPNYFRILAYTNSAIAKYNEMVRAALGYNTAIPQVNEPMVGYENWGYDWKSKTYEFVNSESYSVKRVQKPKVVSITVDHRTVAITAIPLTLKDSYGKEHTFDYIDVKNNPENRKAAEFLAAKKNELWRIWHSAATKDAKSEALKKINEIERFLFINDNITNPADRSKVWQKKVIDFGYALTVHKSQGSTFTHVLIDDPNISTAKVDSNEDYSKVTLNNAESVDLGSVGSSDSERSFNPAEDSVSLSNEGGFDLSSLSDASAAPAVSSPQKSARPSEELSPNEKLRQQLRYVAISRATDTATVLSNNVKKADSPLNHLHNSETKPAASTINPAVQRSDNEITKQLTDHLKSMGINVLDKAAMRKYFEEHPEMAVQMARAFGKENPYLNSEYKEQIPEIQGIVKQKKYSKAGTDAVTLESEGHKTIYLIDHSADKELADNLKKGDGFGIRKAYNIKTITKEDVREIIRNISPSYEYSTERVLHALQTIGLTKEHLLGINLNDEFKRAANSTDVLHGKNRGVWSQGWFGYDNSNSKQGRRVEGNLGQEASSQVTEDGTEFFLTPQGEVYGFVDKNNNIYLDETKISPEHPLHEYTHLWDRAVAQKNPELWKRGIELMKETPLWKEILTDPNYGKKWAAVKGMTMERLYSLVASEAHARLTGKNGADILENIAKQKGKQGIVSKLRQWLLDFWRNLNETFTPWSEDELDHLTLEDFNNMTLRDFSEGVNPLTANNNTTNNNNNETGHYKQTDEFRRVQEAVRGGGKEESSRRSVFEGYLKPDQRQRLANVLGRQLGSINSFIHGSSRTVSNQKHGTSFRVHSEVDPKLFHDVFEVVRYYTKNAELVDLHDDYSDCKCFLTEDGTAGFAVEPDGNLVSVFNLGITKGFLSAVRDMVREAGATHLDAYASSKQNLQLMYEKTLGFHTASSMDYNMEYDHDDIAKNHGNPQVVFMVDHEVSEPKHFDKDSYDAAQQYQLKQLNNSTQQQPSAAQDINQQSMNDKTTNPAATHSKTDNSTLVSDLPKAQQIEVPLSNYENYAGIESHATVDAEWKIPYLQELDKKFTDEGNSYSATNDTLLKQMKQVFLATSEKAYLNGENDPQAKQKKKVLDNYEILNNQLNELLEGTNKDNEEIGVTKLKASEVRHTAELVMNAVSDEIDRLQTEVGYASEHYPLVNTDLDFRTASRRQIADTIGLDNIFAEVKKYFDSSYDECTLDGEEALQGDLIAKNWEAVLSLGSDYFNLNEGFGVTQDFVTSRHQTTEGQKVGFENYNDNTSDPDAAAEVSAKDEQERWMVEMRTIDVLNSMSDLVRHGLRQCFLLNPDGSKVMSKWGIAERVNPRTATSSILRWAQGSASLDDMVSKLSDKQAHYPWLSQLITKLADKSGKETDFQSQFYGIFSKPLQLYSVGLTENGKYYSKLVNAHPALTDVMDSITTRYKMGESPLFYSNGMINERLLGDRNDTKLKGDFTLFKARAFLTLASDAMERKQPLTDNIAKGVTDIVTLICKNCGWDVSKDLVAQAVNTDSIKVFAENIRYITNDLEKALKNQKKGKNRLEGEFHYDPFGFNKDWNIRHSVLNFITPMTEILEDTAVTAFYNSGKMYQSYVLPSFMTKLMQGLSSSDNKVFEKTMKENYENSEWFASFDYRLGGMRYKNPWLGRLHDERLRKMFAHKVQLSFNDHSYMRNMSDAEYTLSLFTEYFAENKDIDKNLAPSWYRVPMQSNKPSSDFIRFFSYRGEYYKKDIVRDLHMMFLQELSRIQTVRMRNLSKEDDGFIKNFDTNGRKFCFLPVLNNYLEDDAQSKKKRRRLHNSTEYDADRLEELQNKDDEYGRSAVELKNKKDEFYGERPEPRYANKEDDPFYEEEAAVNNMALSVEEYQELKELKRLREADEHKLSDEEDNRLASLLQKKVTAEEALSADEEMELSNLVDKVLYQFTENKVQAILDKWQKDGILEAAQDINNIYPNHYDKEKDKDAIASHVRKMIENFLWNDSLASKNILQLTVGDIACYSDTENLQKRLSQLHAPGTRGNKYAVDYNGKPVSDGTYRTAILKDFNSFISNVIDNISEVFDRKINAAKTEDRPVLESLKEFLVGEDGEYRKINVADAQGFSCPSSYRKKAFMFGKWSKDAERVYQSLLKGDFSDIASIKKTFQPLKPFVYGMLDKKMGVSNAPIQNMKVPFQAKNSEYLLIMADALLQGEETSRPNLLRAVYRIMEETEKINPTMGIDTVQFESAIKSGLQTPIDINQFLDMEGGEDAAYTYMKNKIFKEEYVEHPDGSKERVYKNYNSDDFVEELSYDDYSLQQEIPEHFKDHSQAHGSQIRMIIPSDLDFYTADGKVNMFPVRMPDGSVQKLNANEIKERYEKMCAENIEESLNSLAEELHLNSGDKKARNIAISKILQEEISSSPRYGVELMQACCVDENGNFRIPKGDPIQAKRIEQLLNSIIKNRINKQKIAGGPVVQVSNFGCSRQLHIRFNDRNGNLLPLEEEYVPSQHDNKSYKEYIKENQGGIAYFEVFAPAPSEEIRQKFELPDGSINIAAIEATDPELLKMISYRIPTEDKYSCAPMKVVGFMPKWAGEAIMLPYELTTIDDSDFDIDKRYVMRKEIDIKTKERREIKNKLFNMLTDIYVRKFGERNNKWVNDQVVMFLDNPQKMKNVDNTMRYLWKKYQSVAYKTEHPTSGRKYRNNMIVEMSNAILSNEMTADKILNPGGFAGPKKMGYMIAAYKNHAAEGMSWDSLKGKKAEELKALSYTDKDLTFADTQVQFYKQNAAAGSLIGVFAVNKVAHATLESDGFYVDVAGLCGSTPFMIADMTFEGKMELDVRYDREGNLVGKVLGSLVSASADAVKDPILNLMNINMSTANILNTLLRLGMPFNKAALFLSQDVITRLIDKFNRENLNGSVSMNSLVDKWLDAYAEKNHYDSSSAINSEPLEEKELVEGLTSEEHEKIDYKVLLAYKRLQAIADAIRKPTFATRFNSISSAVGPLIIDNLIMDKKMRDFTLSESVTNTGIFTKEEGRINENGEEDPWIPADINTVFAKHPILENFAAAKGIADNVFFDMPAASSDFKEILNKLPDDISSKVYGDKKLLDQLSQFYQSYLLVQSGVIDSSHLKDSIDNFPKEFITEDYKKKYPDNELIKAIRLKVPQGSDKPYLTVNFTGMDEQQKEALRYAWIDLHKSDPVLSKKLFEYSFFLGGIGFSPKTLMALVPLYVKERIKSDDGRASYIDTYRRFPSIVPDIVVDQFIRNNWNNSKLVPWKNGKNFNFRIDMSTGTLIVHDKQDLSNIGNISYMKVNVGRNTYLWKLDSVDSDSGARVYKKVMPLGDNGRYLEINPNGDAVPASDTLSPKENDTVSEFDSQSPMEADAAMTAATPVVSASEQAHNLDALVDMIMKHDKSKSKKLAEYRANEIKENPERFAIYLKNMFAANGMKFDKDKAVEEAKKYC